MFLPNALRPQADYFANNTPQGTRRKRRAPELRRWAPFIAVVTIDNV